MNNNIVILADGEFPHHEMPRKLLQEARVVVCCDRAYLRWDTFAKSHMTAAEEVFAIGDGDSMPEEVRKHLGDNFVVIQEQNDNDLTKAVHFCFARGWRRLTILGATGLREDHTLGNISLLVEYERANMVAAAECRCLPEPMRMVTDFGVFTVALGKSHFISFPGQQVSLFSIVPDKHVSVSGLQYPIQHRPLLNWWEGTLNNAVGTDFEVEVEEGGALLVYQTHSDKEKELQYKGERMR